MMTLLKMQMRSPKNIHTQSCMRVFHFCQLKWEFICKNLSVFRSRLLVFSFAVQLTTLIRFSCLFKKKLCCSLKIHKVIIISLFRHNISIINSSISNSNSNSGSGWLAQNSINFSSSLLFKNVINIKCYFSRLILLFGEADKIASSHKISLRVGNEELT